jgi:uncharacterized phosphosugar-binding protein
MQLNNFVDIVKENLDQIIKTQSDVIMDASTELVDCIERGNSVFVFGCTHAGIIAQEMFYRTGGLAIINPLLPPGLTCDVRPITLTSSLERLDGFGRKILQSRPLKKGDLLFIHSVSGRNSVPVEMAIVAKEMGVRTIALTNVAYSSASTSRHESGKRLFEVCDLVIDNCGIFGDAALEIEGVTEKTGPTSTITGAVIMQSVAAQAIEEFINRGITPPIFISANVDGGDEHNKMIMEQYKAQIHYL